MKKVTEISSFSVILITVALMVVGAVLVPRLSVQYKADFVSDEIDVDFSYPASARIVEADVTPLIEGAANTVPGVEEISSISAWGGGSVTVGFKKGTDMAEARFNLSTRLRQVKPNLPKGAMYELGGMSSGREYKNILTYTFYSSLPVSTARRIIEKDFVQAIGNMDGVDRTFLTDGPQTQLRVIYDPDLLESVGLSVENIYLAILESSENRLLGSTFTDSCTMTVRLVTDSGAVPIEELPIGMADGRAFRLGDFASVIRESSTPMSYHRINGLESMQVYVYGADGINTMKTCKQVRKKADELLAAFPETLAVELSYDASDSLGEQIRNVVSRAVISLLLLLLFVLAVSRSFRYLGIIGLSVLADLLVSVVVFAIFDVGIDMFSMAGITVSFGIIMDTAIVMTDHYSYYGDRKALSPIAAALFTTVAALLLVFYLPDELRRNLAGFVWVTVIILCLSFLTAVFLVPALADSFGLKGKSLVSGPVGRRRRVVRFSQWYAGKIVKWRKRRLLFLLLVVLLFAGTCFLFILFNRQFVGEDYDEYKSRTLDVYAVIPQGYGIEQADKAAGMMENYLAGIPEIERFETDVIEGNISITISFNKKTTDENTISEIRNAIWEKALTIGGMSWTVMPFGNHEQILSNYVGRKDWPSKFTLYGYDYDLLSHFAIQVMNGMLQNPRVKDAAVISSDLSDGTEEEFFLEYDKERLARMDVSPYAHFANMAGNLIDMNVGRFGKGKDNCPVVLQSKNLKSFDLWHAQNAIVGSMESGIRLSEIGSLQSRKTGGIIERKNQEYVIDVGYEFVGNFLSEARMCYDEEKKISEVMPLGFRTDSYADNYTSEQKRRLWTLLIIVVCVIFGICAAMFESVGTSLAIIMLIPSGFIGIFMLFPLLGLRMGQGCLASMVMMSGLVVNAAIYIAAEYRDLSRNGRQSAIRIYVKAFNRKIVPTLLTIASTVIGLVPFLFDGLDSVFWFTFAAGVMAGLLFSITGLFYCFPLFLPVSFAVDKPKE